MAIELPNGGGVYFIKVGNCGYVGQTVDYNARLGAHIRNAYYGSDNDSAQKLYWKMKIHRLQDVEITLYPGPNYGINDFDKKFESFLSEWQPVGKRVSRDSAVTDAALRLDFAEIYHIMCHLIKKDCTLTNIEVGGQVAGWTSRQRPTRSLLNKEGHAVKLITRQTLPEEAYQTFLRGAFESMNLAELTEQIYNDLFDDKWATIFNNKYLPIARSFDSTNNIKSLIKEINNAHFLPWSMFFKHECVPEIIKRIPNWIVESTQKNGVKTIASVRSIAADDMSNFVKEKFLQPRQKIAEKMLEWLFYDSGYTAKTTSNIVGHFDFTELGKYIGDMVSKLIVKIKDKIELTDNKLHLSNNQHFKPIRFSVVWHSSLHKDASKTRWLLDDLNISSGQPINRTWLKYRSYLMFDYFMDEKRGARAWNAYNEPVFSKALGRYYIPLYNQEPGNWLSTRIHRIYAQYAPGYDERWFDFYRPMISLWRSHHNRPDFQLITVYEKEQTWEYLGYESPVKDALVLYQNIKNFIKDVDDWDQLKIY